MHEIGGDCEPHCHPECPKHGKCIAPNKCECNEGYVYNQMGELEIECNPKCSRDCSLHGKCVAPELCECFEGFQKNESSSNLCQPICSKGCKNGICFAPETCVCNAGFLMSVDGQCEPFCSLGCTNGKCIDSEICECLQGYAFANNSVNNCEPICNPKCENAECESPNTCSCWDGYEVSAEFSNKCEPICEKQCLHGKCIAPNRCACEQGYELDALDSNQCLAKCNNCINGDCVAPNQCKCWQDFELNPNTQQCQSIYTASMTTPTTTTLLSFNISHKALELPLEHCLSECQCWQLHDDFGSLTNAKCVHQCVDDQNESCMDLKQCKCTAANMQLICKNFLQIELDEDDDFSIYDCKVKSKEIENMQISPEKIASSNAMGHKPYWYWFAIALCAIVLIVATAGIFWHYYKRPSEGTEGGFFFVH